MSGDADLPKGFVQVVGVRSCGFFLFIGGSRMGANGNRLWSSDRFKSAPRFWLTFGGVGLVLVEFLLFVRESVVWGLWFSSHVVATYP